MSKLKEFKNEIKRVTFNQKMRRHAWREFHRQRRPVDWAWGGPQGDAYKKYSAALSEAVFDPYPLPSHEQIRHMHIAYGMLKGKEYKEIESRTKLGNAPNMDLVRQYMEKYTDDPEPKEKDKEEKEEKNLFKRDKLYGSYIKKSFMEKFLEKFQ